MKRIKNGLPRIKRQSPAWTAAPRTLISTVLSVTTGRSNSSIFNTSGEYAQQAENFISFIPPEKYPYMNRLSHYVIEGRYDGLHDFEFGLDLILDGLERLREKQQGEK